MSETGGGAMAGAAYKPSAIIDQLVDRIKKWCKTDCNGFKPLSTLAGLARKWEAELGEGMAEFVAPEGGFKNFNDFFAPALRMPRGQRIGRLDETPSAYFSTSWRAPSRGREF
ncbi:hypothetical protein ACTG9Q_14430 [Actinokineospora sp. 24-640]